MAKRQEETPEQQVKRERELELSDIREVIKTPAGRRFYWRVMTEGMMFRNPNVENDNGYETKFNIGKQYVGRWALDELLKAKPEAYLQMQNERASYLKKKEIEAKDKEDNTKII